MIVILKPRERKKKWKKKIWKLKKGKWVKVDLVNFPISKLVKIKMREDLFPMARITSSTFPPLTF